MFSSISTGGGGEAIREGVFHEPSEGKKRPVIILERARNSATAIAGKCVFAAARLRRIIGPLGEVADPARDEKGRVDSR